MTILYSNQLNEHAQGGFLRLSGGLRANDNKSENGFEHGYLQNILS